MYKLIVSDLDETLLTSDKNVSEKDIETINNLKDVRFVLSTGRGFDSVGKTLKQINQYNKQDSYTISFNGGVITENKDNRIIYEKPLDFDMADKLFKIGLNYDVCIHVYTKKICYTYNIFENEDKYLKTILNFENFYNPDISFLKDEPILKVLYASEDFSYLEKIRKQIDLEDQFEISFSADKYLEFNPKGVNKGFGLIKLCELLNIDIKDTIAIGDSTNDLSMLKEAGLSIAVKNAVKEVKDVCDVILDVDHNNSPITYLIENIIKTED